MSLTRRAALAAAASLPLLPPAARAQLPAGLPAGERRLFDAGLWRLPNGLRVVHVENHRAPVVAHYLYYAAGSGEDPSGKSGTAHFLEHMMFKGSRRVASGEFNLRVAREGGQDNAYTSRDVTAYHQTVEASRLPLMAMMEADRLEGALLPEAEVEPERSVILEERRQRTDANPRARFREAYDAAMWGAQHWRGRPIIGWQDEIRAISRQDLFDFHSRWYAPGNAVLVVCGAVGEAELRRVVEAEYGGIPAREAATRHRAPPPEAPLEARLVRNDPQVQEAQYLRSWIAPTLTWGASEHADPLEVLLHLLGGGPGSRLHKALVETGLAVQAGGYYDSDDLGVGNVVLYGTPRRDVAPAKLEAAMEAEVARLLDGGVTEAEVARSRRQVTAGALLALDGLGTAPRLFGHALSIGLGPEVVEYWPARIRAVTREQVEAAARTVFTHPSTTGWLLPEGVSAS
ncbi:insulinase family protein [Roseomonas sp. OT10]|uniref:M16 family metallopeptidase n=1 Tax=Roseomonas cutis TaxID=2897332 RepID=UPI001E358A67|nr:pitrilysin family protein [Roseomonas sp. OT10]UFN47877.1 insulinase family protein [Roseomonas sp. OT10]